MASPTRLTEKWQDAKKDAMAKVLLHNRMYRGLAAPTVKFDSEPSLLASSASFAAVFVEQGPREDPSHTETPVEVISNER